MALLYLCLLTLTYASRVACRNSNEIRSRSSRRLEMTDNDYAVSLLHRGNDSCSPWFDCGETDWLCDKIPYDILKCSDHQRVSILTCHCATYNEAEDIIEVGKCIYNTFITPEKLMPFKELPTTKDKINDVMCEEINRTGTLCGKCKDGSYPLAYSFDMNCVECPNGKSNWWRFVLLAFLPLTVFYFVILLFKISVTSSHLHGFVYFGQGVSMPIMARYILANAYFRKHSYLNSPVRFVGMLYGIWNLDFFRSVNLGICMDNDTLQILALDLAVGIYPLLLMGLTYLLIDLYDRNFKPFIILWKPFRAFFGLFQRNLDIKTSLIDAFATFFVLSNMKFLSVSFDLLAPVQVYQLNSTENLTTSLRWFYNASVPYFREEHLPYGILGIAVLLFLVLLPTILLTLYPFRWFQKLLNLFPVRWYILHTFMDSFQGCYKDGTQPGTRDCRWFASLFFIVRFLILLIGLVTLTSLFFPLASMVLVIFIILLVSINPFKERRYTVTNAVFLLLLALSFVCMAGFRQDKHMMAMVFLICSIAMAEFVPLLYVSALTLHWMYRHRKFGLRLIRRLHASRHGYEPLE